MIIGGYKNDFNKMTKAINFNDTNKPFTLMPADYDLGLNNPYSRVTCFVLYLFRNPKALFENSMKHEMKFEHFFKEMEQIEEWSTKFMVCVLLNQQIICS